MPKAVKLPSPQERLDLILLGLARRTPVAALCRQAGVSRELFYRWTREVRAAGLRALEAKFPGPKRLAPEKATARALKLEKRLQRLEKEARGLRKERDHWRMLAEMARRIIRRQGWGPAPRPRFKKKAMPSPKRASAAYGSGPLNAPPAPKPELSPGAGASAEAPIGDGLPGRSRPSEAGS
jgi:transposase-like protein